MKSFFYLVGLAIAGRNNPDAPDAQLTDMTWDWKCIGDFAEVNVHFEGQTGEILYHEEHMRMVGDSIDENGRKTLTLRMRPNSQYDHGHEGYNGWVRVNG